MGKTEAGQVHGKGPGFSSAKKSSSLRSENCYLLTFDFPRAPLYDGTSSLFPGGLHNYAAQHPGPFSPGQYFLELLDFQMRTVYSGSDLIWSSEFSWVWRVFLTLGLLFVLLNIPLQFHQALCKTERVESTASFAFSGPLAVSAHQLHGASLVSHNHRGRKGRFCSCHNVNQVPTMCRAPGLIVHYKTGTVRMVIEIHSGLSWGQKGTEGLRALIPMQCACILCPGTVQKQKITIVLLTSYINSFFHVPIATWEKLRKDIGKRKKKRRGSKLASCFLCILQ